jgi:2'-5' RNA ligase
MQGVVSVFDAQASANVEQVWAELERAFALKYACVAYPHLTYHLAERYDDTRVIPVLRDLSRHATPLRVTTSGLGIFTGERPVLYLPIVRDTALTRFHEQVTKAVAPYAQGAHDHHYGVAHWMPHITLAVEDLTPDMLPDVIRMLGGRAFNWVIIVSNLSFVPDVQAARDRWVQFPFNTQPPRQ